MQIEVDKLFYTWEDFEFDVATLQKDIAFSGFSPDIIFGLSRGGLIPGVKMSHIFDIPFKPIQWSTRDFSTQDRSTFILSLVNNVIGRNRNVLIVDDIIDTGITIKGLMEEVKNNVVDDTKHNKIKYACLHYNTTNEMEVEPDFHSTKIDKQEKDVWIVYPWEK